MVQWFLETHPQASLMPLESQQFVQHAYEPLPSKKPFDQAVDDVATQILQAFETGDEEGLAHLIASPEVIENPGVAEAVCERVAAKAVTPEKKPAILPGTLRFEPAHGTSGLFVAKFCKIGRAQV